MFKASPALGLVLLLAAPLAAQAQVYKCAQSNGTIGYQSTLCPVAAKPGPHPTAAQLNAQRAAAPQDAKPYDDPYKNSVNERPSPDTPSPSLAGTWSSPEPQPRPAAPQSTSSLVADVQARNRRESDRQAYIDAHRNDKQVNMAACNAARRNLGVLNEQRPVFHYDNSGNRVYVDDKDRASTTAQAQQSVAANCP